MTAPPIRRRMVPGAMAMQRRGMGPVVDKRIGVFYDSPFTTKGTSLALLAFLLYIVCITTVRVTVGTESMIVAIVAMFFEKHKLLLPRIVVWAFALVAWAFVGYATTKYPATVLTEIGEFTKICLVVVVAMNVVTTRARLRLLLAWTTLWFVLYPMRGTLVNYFTGSNTLDGRAIWNGTFSNPNDLAGLCLVQWAICLGLLETERKPWIKWMNIVSVAILPLIVVLTQSRGAFIALVVFGILVVKQNWAKVKKRIPLIVVGAVIIVAMAPDVAFKRLTSMSLETQDLAYIEKEQVNIDNGSAAQRWMIWKIAGTIFAENPVTGVGLGAYNAEHGVVSVRPEFLAQAVGKRDTHSTYLNLLAELGIVGFVCFGMIVYITLRASYRARKLAKQTHPALAIQQLYLEVGLYAYLVAGIWGTYGKLVPTYFYIAIVCVSAQLLVEEVSPRKGVRGGRMRRGLAPVVPTEAAGVRV